MDEKINEKQIEIIEKKINEALKEIEDIKNQAITVKDAPDLEAIETKIVTATDKW